MINTHGNIINGYWNYYNNEYYKHRALLSHQHTRFLIFMNESTACYKTTRLPNSQLHIHSCFRLHLQPRLSKFWLSTSTNILDFLSRSVWMIDPINSYSTWQINNVTFDYLRYNKRILSCIFVESIQYTDHLQVWPIKSKQALQLHFCARGKLRLNRFLSTTASFN